MIIMRIIHGIIIFIFATIIIAVSLIGEDEKNDAADSLETKTTVQKIKIAEGLIFNKGSKLTEPVGYPHKIHFDIMGDCKLCHHISPEIETPSCDICHDDPDSYIPKTTVEPKKMPDYFIFNKDSEIFEPVTFPHLIHFEIIGDCKTCHHHHDSEHVTTACKTCHDASFDAENLEKPGLKGAFHRKCMGCHKEYDSGPVVCIDCHKKIE